MIPVKNLYPEIERCDLTCVRLFDKFGNKIDEYLGVSSSDLIDHLKERYDIFKFYGQCEMWCATEAGGRANMKGAFKWKVTFASEKEAAQINSQAPTSEISRMKETMELMVMMKGLFGGQDNSAALLEEKIARFKAEQSIELKKLEYQHNDPMQQWGWATPLIMGALGKGKEEIAATVNLMQLGRVAGNQNQNPVATVTNVNSTFEELQKMTNEEKNKRVEVLMQKMYKLVSAEQFIMLLQLIIDKPSRVNQAITAAAQGII